MMKKLFTIFIVAITSITCSKKTDDTPAPVTPGPSCQITKIGTSTNNPNSIINKTETFVYGSDNRLVKVIVQGVNGVPAETTTYTYTGGTITKATYTYNSNTYVANWTVTNGSLVKVDTPGPPEGGIVDFTYEGGTRVKTRNYKRNSGQEAAIAVTYGSSGNPDSYQSSIVGSTDKSVDTYSSFDTKTNPYSVLAASMGLTNYLAYLNGDLIPESLGKNNILASKTSSYASGSATPQSETNYTYVYEYDTKGNVIRYVKSTSSGTTITVTFTYNNCN